MHRFSAQRRTLESPLHSANLKVSAFLEAYVAPASIQSKLMCDKTYLP